MQTFTVELPIPYKSQAQTRRSDAIMTINVQRNLHYRSAAAFKLSYGAKCAAVLPKLNRQLRAVKLTYILHLQPTKGKPTKAEPYRGSNPKNIDLVNIAAVVDKVFADELVKAGIIPDDTIAYIESVEFKSNNWSDRDYITAAVEEVIPQPDHRLQGTNNEQPNRTQSPFTY